MKVLTTNQIHAVSGAININPSVDHHVTNLAKGAFLGHLAHAFLSMISSTKAAQGTFVFLGAAVYGVGQVAYDVYSSQQSAANNEAG